MPDKKKVDSHITSMADSDQIKSIRKRVEELKNNGPDYEQLCVLMEESITLSERVLEIRNIFKNRSVELSEQTALFNEIYLISDKVASILNECFKIISELISREKKVYDSEDFSSYIALNVLSALGFYVEKVVDNKDFIAVDKIEPSAIVNLNIFDVNMLEITLKTILNLKDFFAQRSVLAKANTFRINEDRIGKNLEVQAKGPWEVQTTREIYIDLAELFVFNIKRLGLEFNIDTIRYMLNSPAYKTDILRELASAGFSGGNIKDEVINLIYMPEYLPENMQNYLLWKNNLENIIRNLFVNILTNLDINFQPEDLYIGLVENNIVLINLDKDDSSYEIDQVELLSSELFSYLV